MRKVYLNGKMIPESRASIRVDDRGFLSGDGVYETLRVYEGRLFRLDAHLKRLARSLRGLRLTPPFSLPALGRAAQRTVASNRLGDGVVRITITRGPGPRGLDPRPCRTPTVLITAVPLAAPPAEVFDRGITAAVVNVTRNSASAVRPDLKSISCLNGILAKMAATDAGAFEGILLTADGAVAEGTVTNVFVVKKRALLTPALDGNLLPGVTRNVVLGLARRAGLTVRETRLTPADLAGADELFLTSSVMEILPVGRLVLARSGRRRTARLPVGPITRDLAHRYRLLTLA